MQTSEAGPTPSLRDYLSDGAQADRLHQMDLRPVSGEGCGGGGGGVLGSSPVIMRLMSGSVCAERRKQPVCLSKVGILL